MATETAAYRFGNTVLDVGRRQLTCGDATVALEPRTFDVLAYLVANRERVVSKQELLDAVWGDHFVGDSALATRIKHARAALGDDGRRQRFVRTVHRVGYQFVGDTTEVSAPATPVASPRGRFEDAGVFGRVSEVESVCSRLDDHQLVTVTGPAGVGKTALAALVGTRRSAEVPVSWCELATARNEREVADVVLTSVGESRQSGADPRESLLRVLERRRELVILDNCEHVVDSVRDLVERLLARSSDLRILATSRESLGLPSESIVVLDPLGIDDAVACFCARAADSGAAAEGDSPAVRELCERLDRLPLAIELAAARARLLTAEEMVELLDDRFRLLRRVGMRPQESLHAAIASSWESLAAPDASLLAGLSVFVGAFTIDDAREVAMAGADPLDVVDALERLVRHSLLSVRTGSDGRSRFHLLESVREFVIDESPITSERRRAHLDYLVRRVEALDAACQTPAIDDALAELRELWVDLRAAVRTALDFDDLAALRRILRAVVAAAELFTILEVTDWCRWLFERSPATTVDPLHAEAMAVYARMLAHQGDLHTAAELARLAVRAHESRITLLGVVWCAYYTGDLETVVDTAPRLVALSRSGRGVDRAYAEGFMAIVAAVRQDESAGDVPLEAVHPERGALGALDTLAAGLRCCASDPEMASELLESVVEVSLERDYRLLLGAAASTLTQIALPARPPPEAMTILARTLSRYRERSMWNLIAADIVMAARLLAGAGQPEVAARLLGARLASGYSVGLSEALVAVLSDELSSLLGQRFDVLVNQGRAWRPPEAAAVAIEQLRRVVDSGAAPDERPAT